MESCGVLRGLAGCRVLCRVLRGLAGSCAESCAESCGVLEGLAKVLSGTFDLVFRRSAVFAIFLSHVVGPGRLSRELNVGDESSLDSAGNAVVFGFGFVETKCLL